ncbi:MAG: bifunctional aspartate kinase/homoserine dehydrogenase I [Saprospiraceae bacterium]|nr:bifunctional aspartate kinase/homoserine dehydrogenase I [Saprospiraceae bacterium]
MKVLKFGGSSVGTPERIRGLVEILKRYYLQGEKFAVVFSAFSGVTDSLLQMGAKAAEGDASYLDLFEAMRARHLEAAQELLRGDYLQQALPELENNHEVLKSLLYGIFLVREASPRTMDYVISFGERNSAFLLSHVMRQAGIHAAYLDARKIIKTDSRFGSAQVDFETTNEKAIEYFTQNPEIQSVTGFIGSTKGGLTTTLGRGGSDYTAAIIGAALDASIIEIWTDVDGVLTADPRKVKKAFTLPSMTYAEAMEMSHFGAKVIYPPTLQPALVKRIPLAIKNTFNPDFPGTLVSDKSDPGSLPVKGLSSISEVALLTLQGSGMFGVPGIAGRLFNALAGGGISVILITQGSSEHSITFAIQPQSARKAQKLVEKEFSLEIQRGWTDAVKVETGLSVLAVIGENMRFRPGIAGQLFQALGKNGVNVVAIAQGSSELNISIVVNKDDESKALNTLHEAFFLSDTQDIHLYIVGTGLIGSTLLEQIRQQADYLRERRAMEIKVVGLANSRKMTFNPEGIPLDRWRDVLASSEQHSDIGAFIQHMKTLNLANTIFVDNTSGAQVVGHYETVLDSSISISTPNKIAVSSSFLQYQRLKAIAAKRGVLFEYETNVGAGLPVISVLRDLIDSGDRILRIEGVLSGTLSFIFNTFREGKPFSSIVREAMERGYTEPDPRDDLNCMDVRRKLLILARERGLALDAEDVEIRPLLPEACRNAKSVEAFLVELAKADDWFEAQRADAAREGKALRMIAKLDQGKASIGLEAVDSTHPFFGLSGSDNMIVFTTERYKERPLVVRGPGAGAEVTAAGVFAEIIKIANFL